MPFELMPEEAPKELSESYLSQAGRGIARTASRVGEQIAGAPGDIFSLINDYIAKPAVEKITGFEGVPYEETYLGKVLPTTESHRKAMTREFGKYIEPQTKVENFIDNVVTDATGYAIPGLKGAKLGSKAMKSLAISTAANTLGTVAEDISADKSKGALVKSGSLIMLSFMDKPRAAKAVAELYQPLGQRVTELAPVRASGLEQNLRNLQSKVTKGTLAPSEKFIFDETEAIISKVKNGYITPEELWGVKRSLNEKLTKVLFEIPKKTDQARARKLATNILHDVDNALKQTARQDPKFYKDLKAADKAFGAIAESNWIANWMEKNAKYNPLSHGLIEMFKGSVGSTVATAALPYEVAKVMYRISNSKVLAKHYGKTLAAAARDDAITMNRELRKMDQELQKEEKKDRFILVDE
jgi:hypothetical protein